MSNLETLDVGQANELKLALRRNGWTNEEVKRLCEGNILAEFRRVLLGHAEIKVAEHVIDCDIAPFIPVGWKVEEHEKGGQFKWNPEEVELYFSELQRKGEIVKGNKLRQELAGKPVLNANVLDYLLAHPHLIPESWKEKMNDYTTYIFFWGTIYRDSLGRLYVRYLCRGGGGWGWGCSWLDHGWGDGSPAALRK